MSLTLDPFRVLLVSLAGWVNEHQRDVIDYLEEENRVLREQLGNKRRRLNDDQHRRQVVKAKKLGGLGAPGIEDPGHCEDAPSLAP